MKSWMKYVLLGVASYLIFVIVQFPANKAYYLVEDTLDDKNVPIEVFGLKGSLWQGSASTLIYDGKRYDAVVWEFHPLELLTAKASVSVRFKGKNTTVKGKFAKSIFGSLIAENVQANIGATELLSLLKIPAVKLGGDFALNLSRFELTDKTVNYIQGRLLWSDAESKFPQKLTMGDVFSDFSTSEDGVILAKLGDGGGPLELNGDLSVNPDGKYDLKGLLAARAGRQSVLGRSLGFIGKYDAKGKASFNKSGNISEFGFLVNK